MASAFKETPSGLGRTTVPGRLVLRHGTAYRPCRLGGLSKGLVIPRPVGRQLPGLGCGNWSAAGKAVLDGQTVTPQRKPATYLKRRKVREIAKLDFCWVLKIFDPRWLEDFLSRAGDHGTHFSFETGSSSIYL